MLQFRILSGTDYFSSFIQFLSMIGSIFAVSLIAKRFGLKSYGQVLTAIITLSVPMGILQSTSTQTDYVAAFFLLSFLFYGLVFLDDNKIINLVIASLALGLGVLTKATLYVYAAPFCLLFGIQFIFKYRSKIIIAFSIFTVIILLINSIYFVRNYNLTGSLFGDQILQNMMKNDKFNFDNTFSNLLRNTGLNLGLPFKPWNNFIDFLIYGIYKNLSIDSNNKETTFDTSVHYKTKFSTHEGSAGNILILLSFVVTSFLFLSFHKKFDDKKEIIYFVICIICGFVLYSLVFKWQVWASRLLLPLFLVFPVFIAYVIDNLVRVKNIKFWIMFFFLISSFPFVYVNASKTLLPIRDVIIDYHFGMPNMFFNEQFELILKHVSPEKKQLLLRAYHKEIGSFYYEIVDYLPENVKKDVYTILKENNSLHNIGTIFKSRDQNYFNNVPYLWSDYSNVSNIIKQKDLRNIGLALNNNITYPLWIFTNANENGIRFGFIEYHKYLENTRNFNSENKFDAILTDVEDVNSVVHNREVKEILEYEYMKLILLK
jgi:hypothetical protein